MKSISKKVVTGCQWMAFALCFLIGTAALHAQTITGNQVYYDNGSTVTLNGAGFAANEKISLQVMHLDNTRGENTKPWVVTTNANGAFHTIQNVLTELNEDVADLKVTANARTSGSWVQFFLDDTTPSISGSGKPATTENPAKDSSSPPPPPGEFLIDCTGAPDPGNTLVSINPVCANIEFTLSLQNSGGPGVTYQWQSNTGGGFADIAGATDATLTTSQSVGTNYQCIVTCTNSDLFTVSSGILVAVANSAGCPLTVVPGGTATQIAEQLLGPGVTVSNATLNCTSNAYGVFTGGLANLGLNEGIVLTSGSAVDLIGPNNSWF
ncbi:MAG TPA: choice-of-anchor L domain-containing protein, partial [Chitinophagales bacterium]|nr:choice-of-anchor L domain-containing protein [Chitinophagales bacterium]